jgi:hypothetical protein
MGLTGSAVENILKNSTGEALQFAKNASRTTKVLGGIGIALTAVDIYNQRGGLSKFTAGDWTKLALQGVTFIPM